MVSNEEGGTTLNINSVEGFPSQRPSLQALVCGWGQLFETTANLWAMWVCLWYTLVVREPQAPQHLEHVSHHSIGCFSQWS